MLNKVNVEVQRNQSESNSSLLRRFTKRVQGAGILIRVRANRYKTRAQSPYKMKQAKLKYLNRKAEVLQLIKLGKMTERTERR